MITPLLYVWGDDDLIAERLVERFERGLEAELGSPLERWDLRAELTTAGTGAAQLQERLGTGVLFGGGTLAVVANPGALVRRNDTRDRVVGAIGAMAAGNAVVFVEAARSGAKGPGPKRLADAVVAAGGRIVSAMAPRPTALGAWIESEARERGMTLGQGAARELADRLGARVTDGDVDRRYLSRIASGELDKLTLRHATDGAAITVDDVRGLVAESTPGSVWALTDAVGERRGPAALLALDRLVETTPEPVLLAVLHRRVVELLELGDRLADGTALPAAARAMGINSEFRARTLATQAKRWTTDELAAALADLVEVDALVKGVPGSASGRRAAEAGVHDVGPDARDRGVGLGAGIGRAGRPLRVIAPGRRREVAVSRRTTRPVPGRRDRSRWRRRSGPRRGRATRSGRGRCTAASSPRTARRGCRSTGARSGRATGTSCRSGS